MAEQGIWTIITDQELAGIFKYLDIIVDIKKKRLECFGNMIRTDQRRTIKKIFEIIPEGSRRNGKPRLKCLQNVREMSFKGWRKKAVDRVEWASVIKEANALRVP